MTAQRHEEWLAGAEARANSPAVMRIGLGKKPLLGGRSAPLLLAVVAGILAFAVVAEEKPSSQVLTAVSSTTLSGYVSTSAHWNAGSTPTEQQTPGVSFLGFTNGNAQVLLHVLSGRTNRLEVSTNLVTWETVGTFVVPDAVAGSAVATNAFLTHTNAVQLPCFYYRLVELP